MTIDPEMKKDVLELIRLHEELMEQILPQAGAIVLSVGKVNESLLLSKKIQFYLL